MAAASTRALRTLAGAGVARAEDVAVDGSVLAFALLLALVTGIVAGLVPALRISRGDLHLGVREGSRGQSRPAVHRPVRELLIAAQVAVALTLLTGAGLMLRSLSELLNVETGFGRGQVLTFETAVPTARYAEGEQIPFYERLYDTIRRQPGVESVGAINILPLSANYDSRGVQIDARPVPVGEAPSIQARSISPDYYRAMGIPLLSGRSFTNADREGAPRVVIISASMAQRYWPNQNPLGQRITFNSGIPQEQQQTVGGPGSREIVGIVGDVKHLGLDEERVPMFYTPQAQQPSYHTMAVVVRASTEAAALAGTIRRELARLDRGVPLYRVRTLDTVVAAAVAFPRMRAWLFGVFAALALALSAIGVFGVVGYLVGERRHEIGVRLALGAKPASVLRSMLLEGMRPVAFGIAAGLATSVAAARLLSRMLYGVSALDVATYVIVVAILCLVAAAATWIPSRRVLTVEPMSALRTD
jgi:putative ABC transport system permease protein